MNFFQNTPWVHYTYSLNYKYFFLYPLKLKIFTSYPKIQYSKENSKLLFSFSISIDTKNQTHDKPTLTHRYFSPRFRNIKKTHIFYSLFECPFTSIPNTQQELIKPPHTPISLTLCEKFKILDQD